MKSKCNRSSSNNDCAMITLIPIYLNSNIYIQIRFFLLQSEYQKYFLFDNPSIKPYLLKYELYKENLLNVKLTYIYILLIDHLRVVIRNKIVYHIHWSVVTWIHQLHSISFKVVVSIYCCRLLMSIVDGFKIVVSIQRCQHYILTSF